MKTFLIQFVFFSSTRLALPLVWQLLTWEYFFVAFLFHAYSIDSIFCNIFHSCFVFELIFFLLSFFKSDCELIDAKYSEKHSNNEAELLVFVMKCFKIQRQTEFDEILFVFLVFFSTFLLCFVESGLKHFHVLCWN